MVIRLKTPKISILNNRLAIYLLYFVFTSSLFVGAIPMLNNMLNVIRMLGFLILVNDYALNNRINKFTQWVIIFNLAYLISCIYNGTVTSSFWFYFINRIGGVLFVYGGIKTNPKVFFRCGRNLFAALLAFNLLYMIFFPGIKMSIGLVYPLGLRINFTIYVFLAIILAIVYDYYFRKKGISSFSIGVIILGVLNLLKEMVATGLIGLILLGVFLVVFSLIKPKRYWKFFILPVLFFFLIVILQSTKMDFLSTFLDYFGKDLTFSSRTYIWKDAIEAVLAKPYIGYGTSDIYVNALGSYHPAHNEILNIMLCGGLLTLVPFIMILIYVIGVHNTKTNFINWFFIAVLLAVSFMMITEIQSSYSGFYMIMAITYYVGNDLKLYDRNEKKHKYVFRFS